MSRKWYCSRLEDLSISRFFFTLLYMSLVGLGIALPLLILRNLTCTYFPDDYVKYSLQFHLLDDEAGNLS